MKQQFFNTLLKLFKEHKLQNKNIIVAVSGGLDSIVLLHLLKELSSPCRLKIYVAHIHHGKSSKKSLQLYRDKCERFLKNLAEDYNLPFLCSPKPRKLLKSEEDFRNFRYKNLKKFLKVKKADFLALAHNSNDLLETRLIHLIRGCGEEGLKSMEFKKDIYLRPLLTFSREEIKSYAFKQKLKWLEDPSNKDLSFLRNWIRNQWLKDLEKKRKGALKSLARSLHSLSLSPKSSLSSAISVKGIKRRFLMELPRSDQKRLLALYMKSLKVSGYGQSHIEEILKLSERKEKKFTAKILKKTWSFTNSYISAK